MEDKNAARRALLQARAMVQKNIESAQGQIEQNQKSIKRQEEIIKKEQEELDQIDAVLALVPGDSNESISK